MENLTNAQYSVMLKAKWRNEARQQGYREGVQACMDAVNRKEPGSSHAWHFQWADDMEALENVMADINDE